MSVISQRRIRARRWVSLWPLALFLLVAAVAGVWLWQVWPQVMIKSIVWQRDVNQQMSVLLKAVAANPGQAGGALLLFSFLYGVLHALGFRRLRQMNEDAVSIAIGGQQGIDGAVIERNGRLPGQRGWIANGGDRLLAGSQKARKKRATLGPGRSVDYIGHKSSVFAVACKIQIVHSVHRLRQMH